MRIEKLEISAYGCFVDRSIPNLSENLVIVHGLNEAGKSTLFNLLTTLSYGFYPVSDFPYHPWHVDRYPELRAVLTLQDGTRAEVWRKLTSTPQGRLTRDDRAQELGNHDLPFVQHVSMTLYKALYALTQVNMRSLEKAQRKEIDDRLLSGLGAELLNPTRQVIADLEKQAQKLWRSDKRGKPLYVDLRSKLKDARKDRKQAVKKDLDLREKAESLHKVEKQIGILKEELAKLSAQVRKTDLLFPLKKKMDQIEKWRLDIPDIGAAQRLTDGLQTEYRRLCDRVENAEQAIKRLKKERKTQLDVQGRFIEEDRSILEHAEKIDSWARRVTAHEQEQHNRENLKREVDKLQRSLESTAATILAEPWRDDLSPTVEGIVLPKLKTRIDNFQEKEKAVEQRQTAIESVAPIRMIGELPGWAVLGVIAIAGGVILTGIAVSHIAIAAAIALGAPLALLAAAGWVFNLIIRRQNRQQEAQREDEVERLQKRRRETYRDRDKTRELIREILKDLPIPPVLLEHPDLELYQAVHLLRELGGTKSQKVVELRKRREKWDTAQGELRNVIEISGEHMASLEGINRLEVRLEAARNRQRDSNQASTCIEEITEELEGAEKALDNAMDERQEFLRRVVEATAEDLPPDEALKRAVELQRILRKIQNAEEQLEMDHPDLAELQEEIHHLEEGNVDTSVLDEEEVEKSRIRRDELQGEDGELQRLREEGIGLQNEIENARGDVSVGELDGKIESIEEEIEDVCTQHDHLVLLGSVLREADRRFREKHQPDVLKRASEYLNTITSGRYTRIITLEDEDEEERWAVINKSGEDRPIAFPLSGGTLDQIYLAFRLAVIDHLDEGYEHLPLVLDEVLINWDDQRFETGVQILSSIAQKRQVFLFTCHDWIVKRIQDSTGASVINLDLS